MASSLVVLRLVCTQTPDNSIDASSLRILHLNNKNYQVERKVIFAFGGAIVYFGCEEWGLSVWLNVDRRGTISLVVVGVSFSFFPSFLDICQTLYFNVFWRSYHHSYLHTTCWTCFPLSQVDSRVDKSFLSCNEFCYTSLVARFKRKCQVSSVIYFKLRNTF